MHQECRDYMDRIKKTFPSYFKEKLVIDVGSQDINGNNKYLFENCNYLGLDLGPGQNVDIIAHVADIHALEKYDTIISTNAFEHDKRYLESIRTITTKHLKPKGLFVFVCATTGTPEHGTIDQFSDYSPHTNDYYKNLVEDDIREAFNFDDHFYIYVFNTHGADLQFWGLKNES